MEEVRVLLDGLKSEMTKLITGQVLIALEEAHQAIVNSLVPMPNSPSLYKEKAAVAARFAANFGANFDALTRIIEKPVNVLNYASLSLVEEADLEAIIALEGMISHARNCDIPQYYKFGTRLNSIMFGTQIDESNNPMDPEQIGEAFKEALRPLGLPAKNLLVTYRRFNSQVFHKLEVFLEAANEYLASRGVMADLDVAARDKKMLQNKRNQQRQKEDPVDRAFRHADEQKNQPLKHQDLLSLVQKLLHKLDSGTAGSSQPLNTLGGALQTGMLVGSKRVEVVTNEQLLEYLSELEARLKPENDSDDKRGAPATTDLRVPLGNLLEEKSTGKTLRAVDSEASDIIQLVTLIYAVIWNDETVPIPIRELIGRTQIMTLKLALQDRVILESETHPVRVLLNELAAAGITWTQPEKLEKDRMYQRIKSTINELMVNYSGDLGYVQSLIDQFREFKKAGMIEDAATGSHLQDADERARRIDQVEEYAKHKLHERILEKNLHPDVRNFLDCYFLKFLVQVVLREGPGGISWRPVMNTVDVLLWSVQSERQNGDLQRFTKIRPRLQTNLAKALNVAGIDEAEAAAALSALQAVQDLSFAHNLHPQDMEQSDTATVSVQEGAAAARDKAETSLHDLPNDDEHLKEVDSYTIGLWFEFRVNGEQSVRCTLAAKIETIEKFVFVNSQGVKVIEKSRMGLARELKAGTVKIICEGPIIDRAIESVIAQLRANVQ